MHACKGQTYIHLKPSHCSWPSLFFFFPPVARVQALIIYVSHLMSYNFFQAAELKVRTSWGKINRWNETLKTVVLKWIFQMIVYEGIFLFSPLLMGMSCYIYLDICQGKKKSAFLLSVLFCEALGHMVYHFWLARTCRPAICHCELSKQVKNLLIQFSVISFK